MKAFNPFADAEIANAMNPVSHQGPFAAAQEKALLNGWEQYHGA